MAIIAAPDQDLIWRQKEITTPPVPSGPLALLPQPVFAGWSWKLYDAFAGNWITASDVLGGTLTDVGFRPPLGWIDPVAFAAIGADAYVDKLFDQSGHNRTLGASADPGPQVFALATGVALAQAGGDDSGAIMPTMLFAPPATKSLARNSAFGLSGDPALTLAWKGRVPIVNPFGSVVLELGTLGTPELVLFYFNDGVEDFVALTNDGALGGGWILPVGSTTAYHSYVLTKPAGTGYDAATWKLFVDGVDQGAPGFGAAGPLNLSDTHAQIGADSSSPGAEYAGPLNGFLIWDSVLSPADLAILQAFLDAQ